MAVLPFAPTPFFRNKNRAFWRLQTLGWAGALMLRVMSAVANQQPLSFMVILLIGTITGFSISMILSVVYRQLLNQRPLVTWSLTAGVLALAVSIYAFIDSWVIGLYRPDSEVGFAQLFLGVFYLDFTLLAAWSALYYAINFFLQVEEKSDQLERMEAQATGAQLAMLRYQLNPHFLFNTLNSISTLVLLKQTEQANAMLTRLSAFLRQTLVNEPSGKVTVAQEADTLKLYLGIEKMRFEERLRTQFLIEPGAAKACMPSMLLQPLVENAIKYGVSPQEEGAEITVAARLVGQRLQLKVSDTGPGQPSGLSVAELPDAPRDQGRRSTGVGLTNIRDRLTQAYGEDHRFELRTPADGGFTVLIELPYDPVEDPRDEGEDAPRAAPRPAPNTEPNPSRTLESSSGQPPSPTESIGHNA